MPKINLLTILPGDSQSTLIDKINYNNDQFLTAGGGPQGVPGKKGETGSIGPQGIPGVTGPQGIGGSKWYVAAGGAGTGPTSGSPLGIPVNGDYWLRDEDKGIFRYGSTGWYDTSYNLRSDQIFASTGGNWNSSSSTFDSTIVHYGVDDSPIFSVLLSDYNIGNTTPNYTGASGSGLNDEKSKFKIATKFASSYSNLISFGRADLDGASVSGFSSTHNPIIKWSIPGSAGSTSGTSNIWSVDLYNPIGDWNIRTTAGSTLLSSNIVNKIVTSGASGGTLVGISTSNGYFQVNNNSATGASSSPYFSVNPSGVGVKTIATSNAFSVKGGASVAATDAFNAYNFGTGYMGIEKGLRIGVTGFNPYGIPGSYTGPLAKLMVSGNTTGSGAGSIIRASLDIPGSTTNSVLYWGDNSGYSPSGSKNVLVQEFFDPSLGSGATFAGFYQAYGTGANTSTIDNTQFRIESSYGTGTYVETKGSGQYLFLSSNPATGSGKVIGNVNGVNSVGIYSTGMRVMPSDYTNPLADYTAFSVEGGSYFGYNASIPTCTNTYTTGPTQSKDMSQYSRIKVNIHPGDQGWNGINFETFTDNSLSSISLGPQPNVPKIMVLNNKYTPDLGSITNYILWSVDSAGRTIMGPYETVTYTGTSAGGPGIAHLFVAGNATVTGTLRVGSSGVVVTSRRELKENIVTIENALDTVSKLNPVSFDWKDNKKEDLGFVVEELNEILPQYVSKEEDGTPTEYSPSILIPLLTKGMQELMEEIKILKGEIAELKSKK